MTWLPNNRMNWEKVACSSSLPPNMRNPET